MVNLRHNSCFDGPVLFSFVTRESLQTGFEIHTCLKHVHAHGKIFAPHVYAFTNYIGHNTAFAWRVQTSRGKCWRARL